MEAPVNNPYQAPQSAVADVAGSEQGEKLTLKQIYLSFEGRVPRKVFWIHGFLVFMAIGFVIGIVSAFSPKLGMILMVPFYIAMIIGGLAVQVKRWHDRNKSGWWVLINLIPVVGLWSLIECGFFRGTEGGNDFGGDPTGLY